MTLSLLGLEMWLLHAHIRDQLVWAWKSSARSENGDAYRICKVENGSYYFL